MFDPAGVGVRTKGKPPRIPFPKEANQAGQRGRLGPKFQRLQDVADRQGDPLSLRDDPSALAPETLLVFELTGQLITFVRAVAQVPGLELFGEDEGEFEDADEDGEAGAYYLAVPDFAALDQLLSLWKRYRAGQPLGQAHSAWVSVFNCLHDLRRWGPKDRINAAEAALLLEELGTDPVRVEIELVFYKSVEARKRAQVALAQKVAAMNGRVIQSASVSEIAYDALLAELPAAAVRAAAEHLEGSLADHVDVFAIRPQSIFSPNSFELADASQHTGSGPAGAPLLAILDGVPVANHPLLQGRISIIDPDDLSRLSVGARVHGTAMASLAIWGDLSLGEAPLSRPVLARPLLYAPAGGDERFRENSLLVDDVIRAVRDIFEPADPAAAVPSILVINVSLGDLNRPFFGRMSPWARALDWLSEKYAVLFVVSAGNYTDAFAVPAADADAYFALSGAQRCHATLQGVHGGLARRRLIAPAEAMNAVTVGASHVDGMAHPENFGRNNHDPLPGAPLPSPISRHGPGFRNSIKPEILAPGGKLRATTNPVAKPAILRFNGPNQYGGLRVAGPTPASEAWSGCTSGSAALASRAAHRIYDALQAGYGENFTGLGRRHQVLILKALLVHRAKVPDNAKGLIEEALGPHDPAMLPQTKARRRKANIRRLYGYGIPNWDEAVACLQNRATLWGYGALGEDEARIFKLPLPVEIFGNRDVRRVTATVSWFSPISPGRRAYKAVRLSVEDDSSGLKLLGVGSEKGQVGKVDTARGTVFQRSWDGGVKRGAIADAAIQLKVVRHPDSADDLPDIVPFGLAVTLETENGAINIYDPIRAAVAIKPRVPVRVGT